MDQLKSKVGILILISVLTTVSCMRGKEPGRDTLVRFDKMLFTQPVERVADSIRKQHPQIEPFFRIFNEEIIRIGPDTLPDYARQLARFTRDSLIREVYQDISNLEKAFEKDCRAVQEALDLWSSRSGYQPVNFIVTYISGFNQPFVTLPGILAISLDNYLGSDSKYYQGLGIPAYIRKYKSPEYLTADAVRAWLYSELPPPEGGFLERMIYEGKIYYLASQLLPGIPEENLFHYSGEQTKWCREQERAMWKYLAEQKILFSTDRLTTRKFLDEAPFTRDFGNDSPGRVGAWIGYRIVSSFVKSSGLKLKELAAMNDAREILSGSRYHP